jgi:uncharacterized protein (DUF488 family)
VVSVVYTVGHSTHTIQKLFDLLKQHAISAVGDVRSSSYSRINPQFNRESLRDALRVQGITYVFLGEELGARTKDRSCYENGKVRYDRLARTDLFHRGLGRLKTGIKSYRLALLCAEKDPIFCHRMVLVSRCLAEQGISVTHILENATLESQEQAEERLLRRFGIQEFDMFRPRADAIAEAFRRQAEAIAYEEDTDRT